MPPWILSTLDVLQLVANVGALAGGAIIWKLYVDKLKATLTSKDAEISSIEKNRDMWKDKAQELEKRSPEFMEKVLSDRLQIREQEILRLNEDQGKNEESLNHLLHEKSKLESDLSRTRGFRLMLAIDEAEYDSGEDLETTESELSSLLPEDEIKVVLLGVVGVDSGQLMVTDPCYIDSEWERDSFDYEGWKENLHKGTHHLADKNQSLHSYSYVGAMNTTLSRGYGELAYKKGHSGAGVVFSTAWGDGIYPVYGELHDGRIIRVYISAG